ncbi:hypothetical protein B0H63DRAFT_5442 [Podospora didyma]|uniref:Coenzyme Q-binding protein COQ10 START domain-containing protein n=1 Tax=Podospora didyma TaxID=330526 RepID=A0AAE0P445_9PEZI|nr:hypothetical protein B0H63DRAFT_5442 [Podospora didyma]
MTTPLTESSPKAWRPDIPPETNPTVSLGPYPTPSHGPGGNFTISYSTRIAASPRICLDTVLKASDYPLWNRFCRQAIIDEQPLPLVNNPPFPGLGFLPDSSPGHLRLGTKFTFDVHVDAENEHSSGRPTPLVVSVLEPIDEEIATDLASGGSNHAKGKSPRRKGYRVAWKSRGTLLLPLWMLRAERVQEFIEVANPFGTRDEPETEYICWETFYGTLAPVVRLAAASKVMTGLGAWIDGLQKHAEQRERTEGAFAPDK